MSRLTPPIIDPGRQLGGSLALEEVLQGHGVPASAQLLHADCGVEGIAADGEEIVVRSARAACVFGECCSDRY
jgi:hypothetical protein